MNRGRLVVMLVISLALAVGAALLARNWLQERMETTSSDPDTQSVVLAATEIPYGESIEASHVRVANYPADLAPPESFQAIADVVGQVANQTIYPDEIIVAKRVATNPGGSSLAAVLEKGKRAVTVRVNDVLGVAGFLLPGNRVDVVATKRRGNDMASETILTDIQVLAVDQLAAQGKDDPVLVRAVTLAVTPEQAERLVKATQEGQVQLTLRNPLDNMVPLLAADPEPAAAPKPVSVTKPRPVYVRPRLYDVEVIRGTVTSKDKVSE